MRYRDPKKESDLLFPFDQETMSLVVYRQAEQTVLVQVAWSLKNERTREREIRSLIQADKELKNCRQLIVTLDETASLAGGTIEVLPLWKFLGLDE